MEPHREERSLASECLPSYACMPTLVDELATFFNRHNVLKLLLTLAYLPCRSMQTVCIAIPWRTRFRFSHTIPAAAAAEAATAKAAAAAQQKSCPKKVNMQIHTLC